MRSSWVLSLLNLITICISVEFAYCQTQRDDPEVNPDMIKDPLAYLEIVKSHNSGSITTNEFYRDSLYLFRWKTQSQQWEKDSKRIYERNINNKEVLDFRLNWNGLQWENSSQVLSAYDSNENLIQSLYQNWENGQWINNFMIQNTFDQFQDLIVSEELVWSSGAWVNWTRTERTLDMDHHLLSSVTMNWQVDQWMNGIKYEYVYNASGLQVQYQMFHWKAGAWENVYRGTYTYTATNQISEDKSEKWNGSNWVNYSKTLYAYDQQDEVMYELTQNYVSGSWANSSQSHFIRDFQGNLIEQITDTYVAGHWENDYRYLNTFDPDQNLVTATSLKWDNGWMYTDSLHFYYSKLTAIGTIKDGNTGIILYPNPAGNQLWIEIPEQWRNDGLIQIFSQDGVQVIRSRLPYLSKHCIDISALPSGIYTLKILEKDRFVTNQFVKL